MNTSEIYTSKKLESIIPTSLIQNESSNTPNPFGTWNATVFFVSRKRCVLATNSIARWSFMMSNMRKPEFENISEIFTNSLIEQLEREHISFKESALKELIGGVTLHRTNNNRAIIGTQNYLLGYVDFWKSKYGPIENWDFRMLASHVNSLPYKQLGWTFPTENMKVLLNEIGASI